LIGIQQSVLKDNFVEGVGFKLCTFRIKWDGTEFSNRKIQTFYDYYLYNNLYDKNSNNETTETPIAKWFVMALDG
jgi:hypothetical protein